MYSEQLSSSKPGLIIILLDQSSSMSEPYADTSRKEFAKLAVNRLIAEIITACTSGDEIKDRCYIAVIGYGAQVNILMLDAVSKLAENTKTIVLKKKVPDGAGGLVEVDELLRIFVEAIASGGTPMAEAFQKAYSGAEKFITKFPNSFPPIIINITDGEPDEWHKEKSFEKSAKAAKDLTSLKTSDGNVILMNAHISSAAGGKVELPSNNAAFQGNRFAEFLFDISSILPDALANKAKDVGFNVQPNAKGFVFNADAETLIRLLNFGSLGALR